MKVSIIVPIYNVEQYLAKCIESLVQQTYENIEILLVNDGSKDNSEKIMWEYAEKDNRIVCLNKVNGGLSDARNYGLKYATGQYCLFSDSDDQLAEHAVEVCVNKVNQTGAEVVAFDMIYVYPDRETFATGGNFDVLTYKENPEVVLINNSACNKMFKTALFENIEFPKGLWYEDLATIPIVLSKASSVVKVNEGLYYYLQRESSIAHTINPKVFDIYKAIHMVEKAFENTALNVQIPKLYIEHGLNLTTIRIKNDADDVIKYWKMNNQHLDEYFPSWRTYKSFEGYSMKSKLIFWLLQHDLFQLVKILYRRQLL